MRDRMMVMTPMTEDRANFPRGLFGRNDYKGNAPFYLPKSALIDGEYYFGGCRNAKCAKWVASENVFKHQRYKFGSYYVEDINHPEDDDGYDCFVPIYACYPEQRELIDSDVEPYRLAQEAEEAESRKAEKERRVRQCREFLEREAKKCGKEGVTDELVAQFTEATMKGMGVGIDWTVSPPQLITNLKRKSDDQG